MSGWAADDTNNADWQDYAAQLRGELPEPHKALRYRAWHLSMKLSRPLPLRARAAIANFTATVGRDFKLVRRVDGRIVIPVAVEALIDGALSLTLAVSIVYVIFFVGVPFIRLLQADGVLR